MKNLPHSSNSLLIRALHWAEWLGLVLIARILVTGVGKTCANESLEQVYTHPLWAAGGV